MFRKKTEATVKKKQEGEKINKWKKLIFCLKWLTLDKFDQSEGKKNRVKAPLKTENNWSRRQFKVDKQKHWMKAEKEI